MKTILIMLVSSFILSSPAFAKGSVTHKSTSTHTTQNGNEDVTVDAQTSTTDDGVEMERTVVNDENGNSMVVAKNITADDIDTTKTIYTNGETVNVAKSVNAEDAEVSVTETNDKNGQTETKTVSTHF
jgi:hypothetical protein